MKKRKYRDDLSYEYVRSLLDYYNDSGIFVWRMKRGRVRKGQVAGSIDREGYVIITIDSVSYRAHRLAHLLMTGRWPEYEMDHKNIDDPKNRSNNSWQNIRPATIAQNMGNQTKQKRNTSGYKGVCWDKNKNKWLASIRINNRNVFLGRYDTKKEAALAYDRAALEYFGEFAYLNFPNQIEKVLDI